MHGIKTTFSTQGAARLPASTAVIGIVGTAPDAPADAFPLDAPC
jgi:phage tail sheath protein FI